MTVRSSIVIHKQRYGDKTMKISRLTEKDREYTQYAIETNEIINKNRIRRTIMLEEYEIGALLGAMGVDGEFKRQFIKSLTHKSLNNLDK